MQRWQRVLFYLIFSLEKSIEGFYLNKISKRNYEIAASNLKATEPAKIFTFFIINFFLKQTIIFAYLLTYLKPKHVQSSFYRYGWYFIKK